MSHNQPRSNDKFQKDHSDILGKTVWYMETPGVPMSGGNSDVIQPKPPTPQIERNIAKILRMKGTKKHKFYIQLIGIIENAGYKEKFDPGPMIAFINSISTKASPDENIYRQLRTIHQSLPVQPPATYNRGEHRVKQLQIMLENSGARPIETFLDYGCGKADTTTKIAEDLKLKDENVYCTDIVKYDSQPKNLNFRLIGKDNLLPFPDNFFDLITSYMVLHHIADDDLVIVVKEIHRVLKPNGTYLIREHDVSERDSVEMTINLDFMHSIYSKVLTTSIHTKEWAETNLYYAKYRSVEEWDKIMKNVGLVANTFQPKFNYDFKKNPLSSRVRIYNKCDAAQPEKKMTGGTPSVLFRTLTNRIPRAKYYRRVNEVKDVLHWGQRKLLLSEIEFLTLFYQSLTYKENPTKPIYMIYAGASPGTHIKYLAKLFPKIHFILYDPHEFDPVLNRLKHVKMHTQLFLDETAKEWTAVRHPKKHILFVSDIRTAEPQTMPLDEVERRIMQDNECQKNWWVIMAPAMAMFKFRLPWDDLQTEYPTGEIYLGIYPPATSTETRLIVFSPDAPFKNYSNREYEEQLFRFNTVERLEEYDNILSGVPSEEKEGLDNQYDFASEIHVIQSYLAHFTETDESDVHPKSIIKISKDISKALSSSRNLSSDQPLKQYSKDIIKTLIKMGDIPSNMPLTRTTYNNYVVGNYDALVKRGILDANKDEGGINI